MIPILAGLALILAAILRRPRRRRAGPPPITSTDVEIFEIEILICDDRLVGILNAESETSP